VRLWHLSSGKQFLELPDHDHASGFAFTADSESLATLDYRGMHLWDLATAKEIYHIPGLFNQMVLSPDHRLLIGVEYEGPIRLWEVASGKELFQLQGHGPAASATVSRDGNILALGGLDTAVLLWDIGTAWRSRFAAGHAPRGPADMEVLWSNLASPDPIRAHEAISALIRADRKALAFLRNKLSPIPPDTELASLQRDIADLDNDDFAIRERASRELKRAGAAAEHQLRQALKCNPSDEMRRRLEALLIGLLAERQWGRPLTAEPLRMVRAIEVIERMSTPEARRLLERLTEGPGWSRLTQEAKHALSRLKVEEGPRPYPVGARSRP
jgi:hypothetical protein